MTNNKLIIASAGSGKTTLLVNDALAQNGKVLILTYTLSNEDVIKRRLTKKAGCIPRNITVQTWFSFLLQHGVRPYQGCLHESLYEHNIKGMLLVNEPSGIKYKNKKGFPVCFSEDTEFSKHYFTKDGKIFSDKISKFAVKCNTQSNGEVVNRLSHIYDHLFIDEVQDLAGYDLELLKLLFESSISILLVGDPRQVTYLTHLEKKYKKYQDGKIKDYIENELRRRIVCVVDETTLTASHRCCSPICKYASLLYSNFPDTIPCSCCRDDTIPHQGVFLIKPNELKGYVQKFNVMQLRWDNSVKVLIDTPAMNFGESKGKTFDRVLIYPTKNMVKWINDTSISLSGGARSKFYVALTRARYSATIVMNYDKDFEYDGLVKYVSDDIKK